MSVNKVILLGNLGSEPEIKHSQKGTIASFRMATSEKWKDKQTGEVKESTEWHTVVFFGRTAEVVEKYLHKGSKVYVEGQLRTDKWQDKEGNDRYTTKVSGRTLTMLDRKSSHGGRDGGYSSSTQTQQQTVQSTADFDDDIPF